MEGCPAGTGRSWKIGSEGRGAGAGNGLRGMGASTTVAATAGASTTGATRSGAGGAGSAGRAARAVTGRSRATGAVVVTGAGVVAGAFAAGDFGAAGFAASPEIALGVLGFGGAGGFSAALRRTVRTRSAIWSGTTLSWFFASKTPPKRSLKSAVSSFEVSPTSFASSKIRTFPAKFTLERRRPSPIISWSARSPNRRLGSAR